MVKYMNFYAMCWFISALICLVLEGSYWGEAHDTMNILNQLVPFQVKQIGGSIPIPILNLDFFEGMWRLLLWDYSFYYGGYDMIRYFWMITLSPGLLWGVGTFMVQVFAQFVRAF